ncbi:MAG: hypothetical protein CM1200mP41_03840 [Gammaproteobacteria bacterium]|nr:MAG: hypothetical protein CM1200mP41_03840 [Gammaproteobacteria bacterium]
MKRALKEGRLNYQRLRQFVVSALGMLARIVSGLRQVAGANWVDLRAVHARPPGAMSGFIMAHCPSALPLWC